MSDILGIIGGMGSEAGAYFLTRFFANYPVQKDQDHLEIILHSNSKVPDRTEAILGKGPSPVDQLNRSVKILEKGGARFIAIACVTAHYYENQLNLDANTRFFNIIRMTAKYIAGLPETQSNIGIIATTGTLKTNLIQNIFSGFQLSSITLDRKDQERYIMDAVYGKEGIKNSADKSRAKKKLLTAIEKLKNKGASVILAGCTEIPLAINQNDIDIPFIDIIEVGVKEIISEMINLH
jgi:aspartate racemase